MIPNKRFFGYVRVSTAEQADSGLGLDAQKRAITEAASRNNWEILSIAQDTGSGKALTKRPALSSILARLQAHEADGLITSKLDRLSRSVSDFASLADTARKQDWSLVVLDAQVDTASPSGELMVNMLACFAQFERRCISQRTKDGLAQARSRGTKLGNPRQIPPATIAQIDFLHRAGVPWSTIAQTLNESPQFPTPSRKPWSPASARLALARHRKS